MRSPYKISVCELLLRHDVLSVGWMNVGSNKGRLKYSSSLLTEWKFVLTYSLLDSGDKVFLKVEDQDEVP